MRLRPYALVTYLVPADRLRLRIPSELSLYTIRLNDGREMGLLSIFAGRVHWVRLFGVPLPESVLAYEQVNLRTYVNDHPDGCVFFFRSFIGSKPAALAAKRLFGFPAEHARINLKVEWNENRTRVRFLDLQVSDALSLTVEGESSSPTEYEGFPNVETAIRTLTHPLRGIFRRPNETFGELVTNHPPLQPTFGKLVQARLPYLVRLGLLAESQAEQPYAVMLVPSSDFDLML